MNERTNEWMKKKRDKKMEKWKNKSETSKLREEIKVNGVACR